MKIPLTVLTAMYRTAQGTDLTLYRPSVTLEFPSRTGVNWTLACIIDSGAPLSVVPYRVWHPRQFDWSSISPTLTKRAGPAPLSWFGVPCELGEMEVELAGTRKLAAKFVMQPAALTEVILGLNFLVDNDVELVLRGTSGTLSGFFLVP